MSNNSELYSCRGHLSTDISTIKHQVRLFGTLYGKRCILLPLPGKIHKNFRAERSYPEENNCFFRNITVYARPYPVFSRYHRAYQNRWRPVFFGLCTVFSLLVRRISYIYAFLYLYLIIGIKVIALQIPSDIRSPGKSTKSLISYLGVIIWKTIFSGHCFFAGRTTSTEALGW